ncbi:hypothetical protein, conserved [Eimeria praecox]|uniref:Protein kinase domain-containing protein n=1 Tax=Eimeria praecox TaxID=51316 RepID=U6H017_9EIME|nr:hypothetical protein, conserved [Eimeria praecox]
MEQNQREEVQSPAADWGVPKGIAEMEQNQREEVQSPAADPPKGAEAGEEVEGSTHRSRRNKSLLTFAAITLPTILVFGSLMYAIFKAQQKPVWGDLVTPQPLPPAAAHHIEPPWQAPPVDSPEERASPNAQVVKSVLWELVSQIEEDDPAEPSREASKIMREIAKAVSDGQSTELVGMTIELQNITEVGTGKSLESPRAHTVTKFIGEGQHSILVSAKDVETGEESAIRINMLPKDEQPSILTSGEWDISSRMVRTAQGILAVRGNTPFADMAEQKGIAAVDSVAKIRGMPDVLHARNLRILATVEKLKNLQVTLRDVLDSVGLVPTGTRAYLARRALKAVLQVQHSGWSNNQINSSNFAVQEDGSVLLFGFESSVPFNMLIPRNVDVAAVYTEPQLLESIVCTDDCETQPIANPKSDLWSLGILLYEIMMDGEMPFGLGSVASDEEALTYVVKLGNHASPENLTVDMEYRGVNRRWQDLIKRLLEPNRERRISAEEIVEEYADLLDGLSEQEVLDNDTFLQLFVEENPDFFSKEAKVPIVRRVLVEDKPKAPRVEPQKSTGGSGAAAPQKPTDEKPKTTQAGETGRWGTLKTDGIAPQPEEQRKASVTAEEEAKEGQKYKEVKEEQKVEGKEVGEENKQKKEEEPEKEQKQEQEQKTEEGAGMAAVAPSPSAGVSRSPSVEQAKDERPSLEEKEKGTEGASSSSPAPSSPEPSSPEPSSPSKSPQTALPQSGQPMGQGILADRARGTGTSPTSPLASPLASRRPSYSSTSPISPISPIHVTQPRKATSRFWNPETFGSSTTTAPPTTPPQ